MRLCKIEPGQLYGSMTVLSKSDKVTKVKDSSWSCICNCGNVKDIYSANLRRLKSANVCRCAGTKSNTGHRKSNWLKVRLTQVRRRAKDLNVAFDLDAPYLENLVGINCPVLGVPFIYNQSRHEHSPTIDRIDPTKGYTKDNVCIISWRANRLKSNMSLKEIEALCNYMKRDLLY